MMTEKMIAYSGASTTRNGGNTQGPCCPIQKTPKLSSTVSDDTPIGAKSSIIVVEMEEEPLLAGSGGGLFFCSYIFISPSLACSPSVLMLTTQHKRCSPIIKGESHQRRNLPHFLP